MAGRHGTAVLQVGDERTEFRDELLGLLTGEPDQDVEGGMHAEKREQRPEQRVDELPHPRALLAELAEPDRAGVAGAGVQEHARAPPFGGSADEGDNAGHRENAQQDAHGRERHERNQAGERAEQHEHEQRQADAARDVGGQAGDVLELGLLDEHAGPLRPQPRARA